MTRSEVRVTVGGRELVDWESYDVTTSLRDPSASCALTAGHHPDRQAIAALGARVQVTIDRRPVFTGYVTSRARRGHRLEIGCHDVAWPLLRDAADLGRLTEDTLSSFAARLASLPVAFSNAANRDLYRRKGRRAGPEPPVFDSRDDPVRVPPGSTRWQALAEVLRRAGVLAWARADGRALVVAKPNFGQEPRYELIVDPAGRSTALDVSVTESIESGFRRVTCVGSSRVPRRSPTAYGTSLRRGATVTDEAYPLDVGTVVVEEVRSLDDARELAQAFLDDERSNQVTVTVSAPGHAAGGRLYAPDTTAVVEDRRNGYRATLYVVSTSYRGDRASETTELELVPLGTQLVIT